MATVRLDPQWQQWLRENVARGCDEASLIQAMVQGGIDPVQAGIALLEAISGVTQTVNSSASLTPSGPAYQYSTPRLPSALTTLDGGDRAVSVRLRIDQPVVAVLDNVLSHQECDQLIASAQSKMQRSTIVDPATGEHRAIDDRNSSGTFFAVNETPFIQTLDRRIARLMHWPVDHGEGLQILNYGVGGEYKPHFDYFPPQDPGSALHLQRGGQRVSTLVIYLNDVELGGETTFPKINLKVFPKKGSAVYFEYCNEQGQVDDLSLHAGAPVLAGEKWIATKWMRERRYAN